MQKLNVREKFSGVFLLAAAVVLLLVQGRELLSGYSDAFRSAENTIEISSADLVRTLHTLLLIVLAFTGSILFLKGKKAGWIISLPVLLFLSTLSVFLFTRSLPILTFDIFFAVIVAIILLLLLSTVFLIFPSTIIKFRVGKGAILPTLLLFMALIAVTFFLQ